MINYPKNWPPHYNACSSPCDTVDGPCCCGSWHDLNQTWIKKIINELKVQTKYDNRLDIKH